MKKRKKRSRMADDYEQRKEFCKDIHTLSRSELEEIYRILRREGGVFSENSNGIFFDLSSISDASFDQIQTYLHFCLTTRQEHENRLKDLESIRMQNETYQDKI